MSLKETILSRLLANDIVAFPIAEAIFLWILIFIAITLGLMREPPSITAPLPLPK